VSFETFEHQADVGLALAAADGPGLFVEAGLALFSLLCDLGTVRERETYRLAGEAQDVEELLVAWLNDLVYLFEAEGAVCSRISFPAWSETAYRAELRGERADSGRHGLRGQVKAATYHGLAVTRDASGWHARVILDV